MVEEAGNVDPTRDGEALSVSMATILQLVSTTMARVDEVKNQVNAQEQILAQLLMGYSELAVLTEAITAKMVTALPEDEAKNFFQDLTEARTKMQQVIQDAARGQTGDYSNLASAVSRMGGIGRTPVPGEPPADSGSHSPSSE